MTDETYESLWQQLKSFLFETAKIVASISIISVPIGWVGVPLIDSYIDHKIEDFVAAIESEKKPEVLEFRGNGIVMSQGPYKPGDHVKILYLLKSRSSCSRDVEVRWVDDSGNPLTHLTSVIPATQADMTRDFTTFVVTLTIPTTAPSGSLVYAPIIRPINCPNFKDTVIVPLSTPIEVER